MFPQLQMGCQRTGFFGPGGPTEDPGVFKRLLLPFSYTVPPSWEASDGFQIEGIPDDILHLLKVLRKVRVDVSIDLGGDPALAFGASFEIERGTGLFVPAERCTLMPGIIESDTYENPATMYGRFEGGTSFTVIDPNDGSAGAVFDFGTKGQRTISNITLEKVNYDHLQWKQDGTLMRPSALFTCTLGLDGAFEGSWDFSFIAPPESDPEIEVFTGTGSFFPDHGGSGALGFFVTGTSIDEVVAASLSVAPATTADSWFSYGGKYNTTTGELNP
jgi:hypothetical protein